MNTRADKLILGNVLTLDERMPIFEAIAVKDGLVQYVGSRRVAEGLCDEHTEVIDYGDNYIYPGFIEAHCHGSLAGPRLAFFADLSGGMSNEEYVGIMKQYMADHPDNEFFYGPGWKVFGEEPNVGMLDAICPDKVMCMNSIDGHSMWMNTKAMEKFGINAEAAKEWGTDIIRLDAQGNPTGYISEGPVTQINMKMCAMSREDKKRGLLAWQDFALKEGVTAYYEAGITEDIIGVLTELIEEGKWKLRVYAGLLMDEHEEDYPASVRRARELADKYNNEYLKIIGVKIFMDGVVEAHTAWLIDEYLDKPGYTGVKRFCDHERVTELYKEASRLGLNVHAHTIGDGATRFALDCIEEAQRETGNYDMRNALAHLQIVDPDDVKRLCELNVVAVVAPLWMSRRDVAFNESISYVGEKRSFYSYPLQSIVDGFGVIAFHSDYPVSADFNIPRSVYMACQRNNPKDEQYFQMNPAERLSRTNAVYGLTVGPAYSVREEDRLGQLYIGYVANLSVFDKDFLHDDIEEVADAKWIATVIDGEEVKRA